jgi:adenylosuccinate synthase
MAHALILILSGQICSGKSKLAKELEASLGFDVFKTKDVLADIHRKSDPTRFTLQQTGRKLDRSTGGLWVVKEFQNKIFSKPLVNSLHIIDAVRIHEQIIALRESFGASVVHVHLLASDNRLFERYVVEYGNNRPINQIRDEYRKAKRDKTEKQVDSVADRADLIVNTDCCYGRDVATRVATFLGLRSNYRQRLVDIAVGAQFGSEGKGQICAHLAPEYDALVRVGGPNAGHSVFARPEVHKFRLLPSGSVRAPNALLLIGPGAVLDLDVLIGEIRQHKIATDRLKIDPNATVITDADKEEEKALVRRMGSTGQGVGAATASNIMQRQRSNKNKVKYHEKRLRGYIGSTHDELERVFRGGGKVLLEGTQGTFLSLHHGIYPYVTSRDTTAMGCLAEAGIALSRVRRTILVTRTYPIRVQNPAGTTSGPFESEELTWEEISKRSGITKDELEQCEKTTTTHRQRRVAEFSWSLFRKACEINSPTDIALTFVDYLSIENRKARRRDKLTRETIDMIEQIESCAGAPVSLISTRFEYRSIIDTRTWKRNR